MTSMTTTTSSNLPISQTPSPLPVSSISTRRLTLRPFSTMLNPSTTNHKLLVQDTYYDFFTRMRRQPAVMQWSLETTIDTSPAQTKSWILDRVNRKWSFVVERNLDDPSCNPHASNSSTILPTTEPIGSIAIRLPSENEKASDVKVEYPELGFMLDETFHGRGYATEAVAALLERFWAETEMEGWDVVEAYVRPANRGSLRVVEKCGFEYLGVDGADHVYRVSRRK